MNHLGRLTILFIVLVTLVSLPVQAETASNSTEEMTKLLLQQLETAQSYMDRGYYVDAYEILRQLVLEDQFEQARLVYEQCARAYIREADDELNYQQSLSVWQDMKQLGYDDAIENVRNTQYLMMAFQAFSNNEPDDAYQYLRKVFSDEESQAKLVTFVLRYADYSAECRQDGAIVYGGNHPLTAISSEDGYLVQFHSYLKDPRYRNVNQMHLLHISREGTVTLLRGLSLYVDYPNTPLQAAPGLYIVSDADGKYGCINTLGQTVIPCQYSQIFTFRDGRAVVSANGKYGVIGLDGQMIIPMWYDKILESTQGLHVACLDGKYGYIDLNGNVVLDFAYQDAQPFSEGLAGVQKNYRWMYINLDGQAICQPVWDSVGSFSEGFGVVCRNEKYGYMRADGTLDGEVNLGFAGPYVNGLATYSTEYYARSAGTVYYVRDRNGQTLASAAWKNIQTYDDVTNYGGTLVTPDGRVLGVWDTVYNVNSYGSGYYTVKPTWGKTGLVHVEKGQIIPCEWDSLRPIVDVGVAIVSDNSKYGLITLEGSEIMSCSWYSLKYVGESILAFQDKYNGLWGLMDCQGNILTQPRFEWVGQFKESFLSVKEYGDYGFIDRSMNPVGFIIWDQVSDFSEGMAAVRIDGLWGFIDATGEVVIPVQYKSVESFHQGVAKADYSIIDKTGQKRTEPVYETYARCFDERGLALMGERGSYENFILNGHLAADGNYYGFQMQADLGTNPDLPEGAYNRNHHLVWLDCPVKPLTVDYKLHLVNNDGEIIY